MFRRILCICLALALFPVLSCLAQEDGAAKQSYIIPGPVVYSQDFEGTVEPAFTPSDKFSVTDDGTGNNALLIDGLSAYIATGSFGPELADYIMEADVRQESCNGGTNAAFAFGVRTQKGSTKSYRMGYSDINMFNPDTRMLNSSENKRDRLLIARSDGSHNVGSWAIAGVSNKNCGILDTSSRSFADYYTMRVYAVGDIFAVTLSTKGGKLIEQYQLSRSEVDTGPNGKAYAPLEKGASLISVHSTKLYVDNIRISSASCVNGFQVKPENSVLLTGKASGFQILPGTGENNAQISPQNFTYEYDSSALQLDVKKGTIKPLKTGEFTLSASIADPLGRGALRSSVTIKAVDSYRFDSLKLQPGKTALLLGEQTWLEVWGVLDGEEYALESGFEAKITKGEGRIDKKGVAFFSGGECEVSVSYNGMTASCAFQVSKYSSVSIEIEDVVKGESAPYSVNAVLGGAEIKLERQEYSLDYPQDGLLLDEANGAFKALKTGKYLIKAKVGAVTAEKEFSVKEPDSGVMVTENFEDQQQNEFFQVDPASVTHDGDNAVLAVSDGITPLYGGNWKDFSVSGKVKIVAARLYQGMTNTSFEVLMRRVKPADGITGGHRGVPFIYRFGDTPQGNYMAIGVSRNNNLNIEDGAWHSFKAETVGDSMKFTIDQTAIYYNIPGGGSGGFQFRAANCTVYLDDIQAEKYAPVAIKDEKPVKITAELGAMNGLCAYDSPNVYELLAVAAVYEDGRKQYITCSPNLKYTVTAGGAKINDNWKLTFDKSETFAKTVSLQMQYMGLTCEAQIALEKAPSDEVTYIKDTMGLRRQQFFQKHLGHAENSGVTLGNDTLFYMGYLFPLMVMYPHEGNYDDCLMWFVNQSVYEETVVGRSTGGGDFVINQMLILRYLFKDKINASPKVWEEFDKHLIEQRYALPDEGMSENHKLVFYTNALLAAQLYPDATMFNGRSGKETFEEFKEYFSDWINFRYTRGMSEYDSTYANIDIIAMETVYMLIKDQGIKQMAGDFLNYLLADILCDSMEDREAGAHGRTYFNTDIFAKMGVLDVLFDIGGQDLNERVAGAGLQSSVFGLNVFVPDDIVIQMARDPNKRFVNRERKIAYNMPDDPKITESLRKYTYVTPNYAIGSIVYYEDPFKGATLANNKYFKYTGTWENGTWIASGHQETSMSLVLPGNDRRFIVESHPGPGGYKDYSGSHGYFSGFLNDINFRYAQEKNLVLGMHKLTKPEQLKFTHMWIPTAYFETIDEEEGWLFIRQGDTYIAIKPLKNGVVSDEAAYRWGDPEQPFTSLKMDLSKNEIITDGSDTAFIMQVADHTDFPGSFEQFKAEMKKKKISYGLNDGGFLEFTGLDGRTLRLEYQSGNSYINGKLIDYENWPMHDSPYMQADWMKGVITLKYGDKSKVITLAKKAMSAEDAGSLYAQLSGFPDRLKAGGLSTSKQHITGLLQLIANEIHTVALSENVFVKRAILQAMQRAVQEANKVKDRFFGALDAAYKMAEQNVADAAQQVTDPEEQACINALLDALKVK